MHHATKHPRFSGTLDNTPISSITMGVSTILGARRFICLHGGKTKQLWLKNVWKVRSLTLFRLLICKLTTTAHVALDLSAAMNLTRIQRPWLVTSCEWNDKLIRSAIVWLCQLTGKPILKLTNKDYNENGLSELLALYGSAYNVNIKNLQWFTAHHYRMAGWQT